MRPHSKARTGTHGRRHNVMPYAFAAPFSKSLVHVTPTPAMNFCPTHLIKNEKLLLYEYRHLITLWIVSHYSVTHGSLHWNSKPERRVWRTRPPILKARRQFLRRRFACDRSRLSCAIMMRRRIGIRRSWVS
jgi:hypothetical protein